MGKLNGFWGKWLGNFSIRYIDFVYKTSKIETTGQYALLQKEHGEQFVLGFWHGESYCFFPICKDSGIYIITTINKRGDYIANTCHYFGYRTIRVPDESVGGSFLFKIRQKINGVEGGHIG